MKIITIKEKVFKITNTEFEELEESIRKIENLRVSKYQITPDNYDLLVKAWKKVFAQQLFNIQNKYKPKFTIDKGYRFP